MIMQQLLRVKSSENRLRVLLLVADEKNTIVKKKETIAKKLKIINII